MIRTMLVVVITERSRQLYFRGRIIRTFDKWMWMEGDWKENPTVTSRFLGMRKWKNESAFD